MLSSLKVSRDLFQCELNGRGGIGFVVSRNLVQCHLNATVDSLSQNDASHTTSIWLFVQPLDMILNATCESFAIWYDSYRIP